MDTLWSERVDLDYWGTLIFMFYYPIIFYQRIKVYRDETMDIGKIPLTNWWPVEYETTTIPVSTVVFIVRYEVPC